MRETERTLCAAHDAITRGLHLDTSLIGQFKIKIFDWLMQEKNSKNWLL